MTTRSATRCKADNYIFVFSMPLIPASPVDDLPRQARRLPGLVADLGADNSTSSQ